jgi:hypothetical protein
MKKYAGSSKTLRHGEEEQLMEQLEAHLTVFLLISNCQNRYSDYHYVVLIAKPAKNVCWKEAGLDYAVNTRG